MEEHGMPEEESGKSAALSDLSRWLAILAAPHGYVATARLLGGVRGDRLLLQARRKLMSGYEYLQEVSLDAVEKIGAAAVGNAFDRAARAAFEAAESADVSRNRSAES